MTLTANLPIDQLQRLQWNTTSDTKHDVLPSRKAKSLKNGGGDKSDIIDQDDGDIFSVTLNAMEIRTFLVRFILTGSQQVF